MKCLGIGLALVALEGCLLQITEGTVESSYRSTTGGTGSGGASSAGATTGMLAGTSSGAGPTGGSSSGGSSTGGSSNGGALSSGGSTGGGCGTGCPAGTICVSNSCTCPGSETLCTSSNPLAGVSQTCVDIASDPKNCGNCGFACSGLGAECSGAVCSCSFGSPFVLCTSPTGAVCTDEADDTSNCGGCGNVCSQPAADCVDGNCACPGEESLCGGQDGGLAPVCTDPMQDPANCGSCGNACLDSYASGSVCEFGFCSCPLVDYQLCVNLPVTSTPTCDCIPFDAGCSRPSFATDIYPLLAQQTGAFGCGASGCHGGGMPAGGLAFLDDGGQPDAGMAYAELLGIDGGGSSRQFPFCDAGTPAGAPSTECTCVSLVVPGNIDQSYLIDTLVNDIPAQCATTSPMPAPAGNDPWVALDHCSQALVEEWVATGANP